MGAVGLQLVCNSGPRCTADLAKILFGLSTGKRGSFSIQFLLFFCPHADFPFYFIFYLGCFTLPSFYCLKVRLLI